MDDKPEIPSSVKITPDALQTPPIEGVTGAANPTPPIEVESGHIQENQRLEATEPTQPASKAQVNPWILFWRYLGKVVATLFGVGSTCLFLLALWDSYRPKITITPGGTLDGKNPFGTYFLVQNQGSLPISHVTYLSQLTIIPSPNSPNRGFTDTEQNVTYIDQMQSLETYALGMHHPSVKIIPPTDASQSTNINARVPSTNPPNTTNMLFMAAVLIVKFDVTYNPKFFGKRTDTLYFFGTPDADGNWQWLPSAHQSIAVQNIDTNLLNAFARPQTSSASVPALTNGSTQVHTNEPKPNR